MLYLDDHFPEHPKVVAAGGDAAWLWIAAACWVKRHKTGGRVPKPAIPQLTDRRSPMKLAARLVQHGLWEDDGDAFVFHEWEDHNWSETRAKKAAHARWGKAGDAQASAEHVQQGRDADASGHPPASAGPPAPRPPRDRPSRPLPPGGASPSDDDDSTSSQAIRILSRRALSRREAAKGPVESASAWVAKDAAGRREQHAARIGELLAAHPAVTAEELADLLEPPAAPPASSPEEASVRAQRERDALLVAREARPCPDCDAGWREVDGDVVPCSSCGRTGVAAGA